jgi:F0F1-type ATP synthase assembly protein I
MKNFKGIQYIVLLSQIGLNIALPIVGGVYAGAYLDKRFSTGSAFLIFGTIFGVFSGIASVYRILSKEFKNK